MIAESSAGLTDVRLTFSDSIGVAPGSVHGRAARQLLDDLLTMQGQGAVSGSVMKRSGLKPRSVETWIRVSVEPFLDRPVKAPAPRVVHHLRTWAELDSTPRASSPSLSSAIKEPHSRQVTRTCPGGSRGSGSSSGSQRSTAAS